MKNTKGKKVAVVIGATSKWQADGRMTNMLHGHDIDPTVILYAGADELLRDCGHVPQFELPDRTHAFIRDFFREGATGGAATSR